MASLRNQAGDVFTEMGAIQTLLAPLGISLKRWPLNASSAVSALLAKPVLNEDEKAAVLEHLDHYFQTLKTAQGYQTRDLVVLSDAVPNLDEMLAKFDKCHTHADDEVRYIIDGEGVFGFVLPDGSQIELRVAAEDYINVPQQVEHWFYLTGTRRIKAIRYFTSMAGWVPEYTGTAVAFG